MKWAFVGACLARAPRSSLHLNLTSVALFWACFGWWVHLSQVLGTTIYAYIIGALVGIILNLDPGANAREKVSRKTRQLDAFTAARVGVGWL